MTKEVLLILDRTQIEALMRDARLEPNPSHKAAQALLDHLLSQPELQDFNQQHGDNPRVLEAYANQNLAKEYVRQMLKRELGTEANEPTN